MPLITLLKANVEMKLSKEAEWYRRNGYHSFFEDSKNKAQLIYPPYFPDFVPSTYACFIPIVKWKKYDKGIKRCYNFGNFSKHYSTWEFSSFIQTFCQRCTENHFKNYFITDFAYILWTLHKQTKISSHSKLMEQNSLFYLIFNTNILTTEISFLRVKFSNLTST